MKWISITTVLLVLVSVESTAQITIKTEYFGTSAYRDEHNQKVGNSKGSAMVYHGSANLPLSMKKNENNQPTIWGIGLSGDYASLNNKNIAEPLVLSEILNLQMSACIRMIHGFRIYVSGMYWEVRDWSLSGVYSLIWNWVRVWH